jgi:hypothetical protein
MADGSVDAVFVGCFGSLTAPPRERVVSCSLRPRESLANRLDSGFSRFESGVQTPFWHPRRSFPMAPRCPSWPPLPPVYVCFYSFAMYRGPESRLVFRAFASRRGRSSPGSRRCPREITEQDRWSCRSLLRAGYKPAASYHFAANESLRRTSVSVHRLKRPGLRRKRPCFSDTSLLPLCTRGWFFPPVASDWTASDDASRSCTVSRASLLSRMAPIFQKSRRTASLSPSL